MAVSRLPLGSYSMIDLILIYYGMAKPEKKPSEMTLEEWAFSFKALERLRKEEAKDVRK